VAEVPYQFPFVGPKGGLDPDPRVHTEELALAFRNHAMPLEALRYDVTPPGLHYLLTHYDVPFARGEEWTLTIDGAVDHPLTLAFEELARLPAVTRRVTFECAGDGRALLSPRPISQPWLYGAVGTAEWTGTPLRGLLERAGLRRAVDIVFTGADRGIEARLEQDYQRALPLADAMDGDVLVAWAMNGQPLPPQHGYPLRLVVPQWYGMGNVKWLRRITAITEPFMGYQQALAYRYSQERADPGEAVTRMRVRSLMVAPGIPDFLTRTRVVQPGPVTVEGRAWSGNGEIARVDFSADGGDSWQPATFEPRPGPHAWHRWTVTWQATPGDHLLVCRATDSTGATQPVAQNWNSRGMGNNMCHRVRVLVAD
jgi:DMSO/TMAO reductase YedYZ molybdopterin-dependent catalytic subunit